MIFSKRKNFQRNALKGLNNQELPKVEKIINLPISTSITPTHFLINYFAQQKCNHTQIHVNKHHCLPSIKLIRNWWEIKYLFLVWKISHKICFDEIVSFYTSFIIRQVLQKWIFQARLSLIFLKIGIVKVFTKKKKTSKLIFIQAKKVHIEKFQKKWIFLYKLAYKRAKKLLNEVRF
jgi:hypothetical protein